ncbi:hypothetical protein FHS31_001857 [Sphingomonas vulcanisoli]|uniref:ATP-binding protein n=1 Tax=Sphingomonas vulcanisoli TaxID=1658060 RepID=A0ABX0TUU5_9SPHN|nr:hypothetical protein [Sphingomonas vulcanisoli]NIJ08240.1 hypothetical protein [Sphingomonas vulcanisoli]
MTNSPLIVSALDIASWAASERARSLLPVLVRRLVHETSRSLAASDFPGYDEAQRPGWDGWTEASDANAWLPAGAVGWELSVADDNPGKPNRDWDSRVKLSPGDRATITFVFITARRWPGKGRWADARRQGNAWADVRAYDAEDLAQWLEQCPATCLWFAALLGRPAVGLRTLDGAWSSWANACRPSLSAKLFDEATTAAANAFSAWRTTAPHRPYVVTADSVGEAVAFVATALEEVERERSIVVEDALALAGVLSTKLAGLIVIADPAAEEEAAIASAQHLVVFARTHATVPIEPDVELRPASWTVFQDALADMGVAEGDRDRTTTEAGRSPTILRRRLAIAPELKTPNWARNLALQRKLVPILLAGAWRAGDTADEACVTELAAKPIEEVERDAAELATLPDAPVWLAGGFRGVVSRKDALFALHHALTEQDISRFVAVAGLVLTLDDPRLDLPEDKRWAAGIYGVRAEVSGALREAVGEFLVLLAIEGDRLLGDRLGAIAARVDQLVTSALRGASPRQWLAQHYLRWLAEASPNAFLDAVEADLRQDEPALFNLLRPVTSSMGGCDRTELLWALELLAWEPRRFSRVFAILAKLSEVPINDNWVNKPEASLGSLVRYWLPQTAASVEERIAVVRGFAETRSPVAWRLLLGQLPGRGGHATPNMRPRWREVTIGAGQPTHNEVRTFVLAIVDLLLDWPGYSTTQLAEVLSRIDDIPDEAASRLLSRAEQWADAASDADRAILRDSIRRTLGLWRLRSAEQSELPTYHTRFQDLAERLLPVDVVERHRWLFADHWPRYDREENEDWEQHSQRVEEDRRKALQEVLSAQGINGVVALISGGNAAAWIGSLLAKLEGDNVAAWLRELIRRDELGAKVDDTLRGLLSNSDAETRRDALTEVLADATLSAGDHVRIVVSAPSERATWQLIGDAAPEIASGYWARMVAYVHGLDASDTAFLIDQLLSASRPFAAFQAIGFEVKAVDPHLLARVLRAMRASQGDDVAVATPDGWHLGEAIACVETAEVMSLSEMASLEFGFFPLLEHDQHGTPHLDRVIAENPGDFVHLVSLIYKRDDGEVDRQEGQEAASHTAWQILHHGRRVPGTCDDGTIDADALMTWIDTARNLGRAAARSTMTDQTIGTLLSASPVGTDGHWPHEAVRQVLDRFSAEHIATGFVVGKRNARGVVTRAPGGGQERALAAQFRVGADAMRLAFPFSARTLDQLAADYEYEAKRWDGEDQVDRRLGRR